MYPLPPVGILGNSAPVLLVVHVCGFTKGLCVTRTEGQAQNESSKVFDFFLLVKPAFLLHDLSPSPKHIEKNPVGQLFTDRKEKVEEKEREEKDLWDLGVSLS